MNVAYLAYMNQYYLCVQLIYRAKSQLLHELCTRQGQALFKLSFRFRMVEGQIGTELISNQFRGSLGFLEISNMFRAQSRIWSIFDATHV